MEEQTWFEKRRADMLVDIQNKCLHSQILVNFDVEDLLKIDEILESFNTPQSKDLDKFHGIELPGIENELAGALIGEAVQHFDSHTMENILNRSTKKEIAFRRYEGEYLSDSVNNITTSILFYITKSKPTIDSDNVKNCFVIASPIVISMLQSNTTAVYEPVTESEFKGPNNTMLVGYLNGIRVYSYLFEQAKEHMIVGYNDPETEEYHSQVIIINNLSFI